MNRLGRIARLHHQPDACVQIINTLYGFNAMEVQQAFVKVSIGICKHESVFWHLGSPVPSAWFQPSLLASGTSSALSLWPLVTASEHLAWAGSCTPQPPCGVYSLRLGVGLPVALAVVLACQVAATENN